MWCTTTLKKTVCELYANRRRKDSRMNYFFKIISNRSLIIIFFTISETIEFNINLIITKKYKYIIS